MKFTATTLLSLGMVLLSALWLVSCQESFDESLQREAREFTEKQCPQRAEEGTMLDSLVYSPRAHVLTHYYSVSPENAAVLREKAPLLHQLLAQRTANDLTYKDIKARGVGFRYVYFSKTDHAIVYETRVEAYEYR